VITIHAEGSPAAQKLPIFALADFERHKAVAKIAAGVNNETIHEIFSRLSEFPPKL
jgi:hypothetical protein